MTPTQRPVVIFINNVDVTTYVPGESISITLERADRVSSCSFEVQNADALNIARWQTVHILGTGLFSSTYFFGYVTDINQRKRGIVRDYELTCSGKEVLLQKAIVDTTCTGTDADIVSCLFSGAYPDLSAEFDLSGISAVRLDSFEFNALDENLLDALANLANNVGAEYSIDQPDAVQRVNLNYNPTFGSNDDHYGAEIPADGSSDFDDARLTWDENGGRIGAGNPNASWEVVGVDSTTALNSIFRIGSTGDAAISRITKTFSADLTEDWLLLTYDAYTPSANGATGLLYMHVYPFLYDTLGGNAFLAQLSVSVETIAIDDVGSWVTIQHRWNLDSAGGTGIVENTNCRIEFVILGKRLGTGAHKDHTLRYDNILVEYKNQAAQPALASYFDGDSTNAEWTATAHASPSYLYDGADDPVVNWSDTPPDADYDVDIGTDDYIDNVDMEDDGFDGINAVVVTGGYKWVDVDYTYQTNDQQKHYDLEERIYAAAGNDFPTISRNDGTDGTPSWTALTVEDRIGGTLGSNKVLYEQEKHWLEFNDALGDLDKGFRVVGRIKQRIRVTVDDEAQQTSDGLTLVDVVYDDTIQSEADAYERGEAELRQRGGTRHITFDTLEPGLVPGAQIDVVDSAQGINETMIIERVRMQYLRGAYVRSTVEAGSYRADLVDIMAQTHREATRRPSFGAATEAVTTTALTDDSGATLTDDDLLTIFQTG